MTDGPYSRIYHQLADEYPDLYDSPDLAGYVRLLVAADQAWPTKARWAGYVTEDELERIAANGLVVREGSRYTVKGMDKERRRRSRQARKAASARWQEPSPQEASNALSNAASIAARTADSNAQSMPRRDETSREETSRDEKRLNARDKSRGLTSLPDILGGRA